MKHAGAALGLGNYAAAIAQAPDGQYVVPDPAARAAIMRLRSDPTVSAAMSGVYTRSNEAKLSAAIGRAPSERELYIAHFLGADGAARLIATAASPPQAGAPALFPSAARPIFYDRFGCALGVGAVYRKLTGPYRWPARLPSHRVRRHVWRRRRRQRRPGPRTCGYRRPDAALCRGPPAGCTAASGCASGGGGRQAVLPGYVHRRAAPPAFHRR